MIRLWREAWVNETCQPTLASTPFDFIQLGPRDCLPCADHQRPTGTFYPGLRRSQTAFQYAVPNADMPNTFMAVAADLAEGIHPCFHCKQVACLMVGTSPVALAGYSRQNCACGLVGIIPHANASSRQRCCNFRTNRVYSAKPVTVWVIASSRCRRLH